MRLKCATQMSLYEPTPVDHLLGRKPETVSNWPALDLLLFPPFAKKMPKTR